MSKLALTEMMGIRLDPSTYELVQKVAAAQGIGGCDFVRWAVKRELAELGVISDAEILLVLGKGKKRGKK
jgi:hypothetical protein